MQTSSREFLKVLSVELQVELLRWRRLEKGHGRAVDARRELLGSRRRAVGAVGAVSGHIG